MHVVLQVIFTTACELVRPKHVVPGTLKILQGQIQFTGDPPVDEGASGGLLDCAGPKTKVPALIRGLSVASRDMLYCSCMGTYTSMSLLMWQPSEVCCAHRTELKIPHQSYHVKRKASLFEKHKELHSLHSTA